MKRYISVIIVLSLIILSVSPASVLGDAENEISGAEFFQTNDVDIKNPYYMWKLLDFSDSNTKEWITNSDDSVNKAVDSVQGRTLEIQDGANAELYISNALDVWDGTSIDTSWYSDELDEFTIYTGAELAGLSKLVSSGKNFIGKSVTLASDIDLDNNPWTPIGSDDAKFFAGSFYGGGHIVSNISIVTDKSIGDGIGLFGVCGYYKLHKPAETIKSMITQLGVENVTVSLDYRIQKNVYVGGLVGKVTGDINNCFARNVTISVGDNLKSDADVATTFSFVAPLAGLIGMSTVMERCYAVNFNSYTSCQDIVGGIVGSGCGLADAESCIKNVYCAGEYNVRYRYNGNDYTYNTDLLESIKAGSGVRPLRFYQIGSSIKLACNTATNAYFASEIPPCNQYRDCYSAYYPSFVASFTPVAVTADKLKSYVSVLGGDFVDDKYNLNDGYPVFSYEGVTPNADSIISFEFYLPGGSQLTAYVRNGSPDNHIAEMSTFNYEDAVIYDNWNEAEILLDGSNNYAVKINGTQVDDKLYCGKGPGINYVGFSVNGNAVRVDNVAVKSDLTAEINEFAQMLKDDLSIALDDYPNVDGSFSLPFGNGEFDVSWISSNPKVISNDGSIVNTKPYTQNVNMIASASRASYCDNGALVDFDVEFPLTVLANGEELTIDDINEYLSADNLTDEDPSKITKDLSLPAAVGTAMIMWTTSNEEVLPADGHINRKPNEDIDVSLTANFEYGGENYTKTFDFKVISTETVIKKAMAELNYSDITSQNRNNLTSDIVLPTSGLYGTKISWSSSNESVLNAVGCVLPVERAESVVLTASFELDNVSLDKEFAFVVSKSDVEKVNIDADSIDMDDVVKENFPLPVVGEAFSSNIEWTSDNEHIVIGYGRAVVTRPEHGNGDVTVTLVAKVSINEASTERRFVVIVKELPSDEELLNEIYSQFDWSDISNESSDSVTQNISMPTALNNGITCEWESLTPEYISSTGVINRPSVGQADVQASVKVTMRKGSAVLSKQFNFTIKAFFETDQVLAKAKNELTFDKISDEPISVVTKNLALLTQWRYGTTISWKSDNENVIKINTSSNECIGKVTRPKYNSGNKEVKLTAKIGYNNEYIEKVFKVLVSEERGYVAVVNETFNDMPLGTFTGSSNSVWTTRLGFETYEIMNDLSDADNKVLRLGRAADVASTNSMPEMGVESPKHQGEFVVKYRLKMESLSSFPWRNYYRFDTENGSNKMLLDISFVRSGDAAELKVANTYDKKNVSGKFKISLDEWHDVEVRISTWNNTVSIYVDNQEIMPEFVLQTDPYTCAFKKTLFRWGYSKMGETPDIDHVLYLDDVQILRVVDSSEDLNAAMKKWNLEFLTSQNIAAITDNLILPEISAFETTVSYKSSDKSVIKDSGEVIRGDKDKIVEYTVTFSNAWGGYREKTYYINVKAIGSSGTQPGLSGDALDVLNDTDEIVEQINKNYTLNYITSGMSLPTSGKSGTTVIWQSSNENALSSTGEVNRGSTDVSVTLYMTVTKKGASDTRKFDITVKKADSKTESGGSVSRPKASGSSGGGLPGSDVINKPNDGSITNPEKDVFSDIGSHWAHDIIINMNKLGFANGVGDGKFDPERPITREEFVKMLDEIMRVEVNDSDPNMKFTDVDPTQWYAPYVQKAYEMGWINGISETDFGVGRNISREDMCVIVSAAVKLASGDKSVVDEFTDAADIAEYALEAVSAMKSNGYISGKPGAILDPKGCATRAEATKILYSIYMSFK